MKARQISSERRNGPPTGVNDPFMPLCGLSQLTAAPLPWGSRASAIAPSARRRSSGPSSVERAPSTLGFVVPRAGRVEVVVIATSSSDLLDRPRIGKETEQPALATASSSTVATAAGRMGGARRSRLWFAARAGLYKLAVQHQITDCARPTLNQNLPRIRHVERLTPGDFTEVDEPFALFASWLEEAARSEPNDPNGMALSTVDAEGLPNVRMVLLKGHDRDGFVFYTNTQSQKGEELLGQGKAAALFHWKSLRRQVRIRGPVSIVSDAEADAYFQSGARDSRIGAWASQQSRPLESRFALEKAVAGYVAKFGLGEIP